jgi:hypothetical protein
MTVNAPNAALNQAINSNHNIQPGVLGGDQELREAIGEWRPFVPLRFWPLITPWVDRIEEYQEARISSASLKALRGMMRLDVKRQVQELWSAPPKVIAAWCEWYPTWVDQLIEERALADPLFLLRIEEYATAKRKHRTAADTEQKRIKRNRELAARLFRHIHDVGGQAKWAPATLVTVLSSPKGGPRIKSEQVREAAETLVLFDLAQWLTRSSGQHWALVLEPSERQVQRTERVH